MIETKGNNYTHNFKLQRFAEITLNCYFGINVSNISVFWG